MKKAFALLLFIVFVTACFAQRSQEEQLGIQYFQNAEYEKAAQMFEKVYNNNPNTYIYYYYYQTLLQLGDFKQAEKIVKKQQKNSPKTQRYKIDLGFIYESSGDAQKAETVYNNAIKELPAQSNTIRELYNAFLVRKQYNYAITTLERGRKLLNDNKLFVNEIANIYTQINRPDLVVNEALNLVNDNCEKLGDANKILQNLLANDEDGSKMITAQSLVQKAMHKNPDNIAYTSLMKWLYELQKDYENALLLAKSLDRKMKDDGTYVYAVAEEAQKNKAFTTAMEGYQYLINKGEENVYYTKARFKLLDAQYDQLISTLPIDVVAATKLEKDFATLLTEYGLHEGTAEWIRKYAHLLAFYVNKQDKAVEILNEAIKNANRDIHERSLYKIDLADIELYRGDVWEATLHYSQVDKDLPNDVIGQNAKFKNAKLSFYIGEFAWAKSQLDVLRAATSKLIANDAMYFSLLISDNEPEEEEEIPDFTEQNNQYATPLRYYAKADFLIFQNKEEEAMILLDSILMLDPYGKLADDVYFQKAQIAIKQKAYLKAEEYLTTILRSYSTDLLADDAMFLLAQLYDYYIKDSVKAMDYYQKILKDYPDSLFAVDARKRYRELRGDFN